MDDKIIGTLRILVISTELFMGSVSVLETSCFLLGNKVILWDHVVLECLFDLYQLYLFD